MHICVKPLCGEQSFAALMRTKPLATQGQILVHGLKLDNNAPPMQMSTISIGLIVPKKCFPLATDRNVIRRKIRANVREASHLFAALHQEHVTQAQTQSIQLLVRFRSIKQAGVLSNPRSADFKHLMRTLVIQAITRLIK